MICQRPMRALFVVHGGTTKVNQCVHPRLNTASGRPRCPTACSVTNSKVIECVQDARERAYHERRLVAPLRSLDGLLQGFSAPRHCCETAWAEAQSSMAVWMRVRSAV